MGEIILNISSLEVVGFIVAIFGAIFITAIILEVLKKFVFTPRKS